MSSLKLGKAEDADLEASRSRDVEQLSPDDTERYSRQLNLDGIGREGQLKLLHSSVLVIGAGGLGSPAALYLAAAGVGTLGIADGDVVSLSNLQRQILHSTSGINALKTESARQRILDLNPGIVVSTYPEYVTPDNITSIIADYDFVLDCTDNYRTKFLINDSCVHAHKPYSHAGVVRYNGQLMTYVPGKGACLRCVFGEPASDDAVPTCREVGVLGAAAGVIGSLQAAEAIKYLTGTGKLLTGCMLTVDILTMEFRRVEVKRSVYCPACSASVYIAKEEYDKMVAHAKACLPNEACGLVGGKLGSGSAGGSGGFAKSPDGHGPYDGSTVINIKRVYLLDNIDHAQDHFTIDFRDQFDAVCDIREHGFTPLGNWHSHPEGPAYPSEEDIRLASGYDDVCLILSLAGGVPTLKAFHIENGSVTEYPVFIN